MKIEILGTGCPKCEKLSANTKEALNILGIGADVKKVEDLKEIMKYRVMLTPALVVDGEVKSTGKVLSVEEIKKIVG
jgi:small redox-active disulfide protein 2